MTWSDSPRSWTGKIRRSTSSMKSCTLTTCRLSTSFKRSVRAYPASRLSMLKLTTKDIRNSETWPRRWKATRKRRKWTRGDRQRLLFLKVAMTIMKTRSWGSRLASRATNSISSQILSSTTQLLTTSSTCCRRKTNSSQSARKNSRRSTSPMSGRLSCGTYVRPWLAKMCSKGIERPKKTACSLRLTCAKKAI